MCLHCCATNSQNYFHPAKLKVFTHSVTTPPPPFSPITEHHHSTFHLCEFNYSLLFQGTKFVAVCYSNHRELIQYTFTSFSMFIQSQIYITVHKQFCTHICTQEFLSLFYKNETMWHILFFSLNMFNKFTLRIIVSFVVFGQTFFKVPW